MYYLDTSAIRSFGKRIVEISSRFSCTTSALTVFEIITGIDLDSDEDFLTRKSLLKNLERSRVNTKWVFHEHMLSRAFGLNDEKHYQELSSKLRKIKNLILKCCSHSEFLDYLANYELKEDFELFVVWDHHISTRFAEIDFSDIKEALQEPQEIQIFDSEEMKSMKNLGTSLISKHQNLNYSSTLLSLAIASTGNPEPKEAYENYDQSIEIFVHALAVQITINMANLNRAGKNDGMDLYHLLYLSEGDTLISNDEKQRSYLENLKDLYGFDIECKSVSEFLCDLEAN